MKLVRAFLISEKGVAVAAMSIMAILPVAELVARYTGFSGVPGLCCKQPKTIDAAKHDISC